eukprot:Gb_32187 [translate_table: standard]
MLSGIIVTRFLLSGNQHYICGTTAPIPSLIVPWGAHFVSDPADLSLVVASVIVMLPICFAGVEFSESDVYSESVAVGPSPTLSTKRFSSFSCDSALVFPSCCSGVGNYNSGPTVFLSSDTFAVLLPVSSLRFRVRERNGTKMLASEAALLYTSIQSANRFPRWNNLLLSPTGCATVLGECPYGLDSDANRRNGIITSSNPVESSSQADEYLVNKILHRPGITHPLFNASNGTHSSKCVLMAGHCLPEFD